MQKKMLWITGLVVAFLSSGCVEIEQEVHMNHDGSGKIVETVALTARGVRLFEGMKKRTGSTAAIPAIFSEEAFQIRLKALGEVTLVSKEDVVLSDGRKQVKSVYEFKDANKIRLWMVPSLAYMQQYKGKRNGGIGVQYIPELNNGWGKLYRESVAIYGIDMQQMPGQELSSPAERQKYIRILPIFLDALKDFHLSIVLIAPIEDFEENDMKWGLPTEKNRATIFRMDGNSVVQSPGMIQQLVMNEVVRESLDSMQASMPGVFVPGGGGVRFMKSTPAPRVEK